MLQSVRKWHKFGTNGTNCALSRTMVLRSGLYHTDTGSLLNMRLENITRDMAGKNGLIKLRKTAFYYLFKHLGADNGTSL